jgi:DNA-directed RNA polymerase specialized sigma24 family protein
MRCSKIAELDSGLYRPKPASVGRGVPPDFQSPYNTLWTERPNKLGTLGIERDLYDDLKPLVERIVRWRLGMRVPLQDLEDVVGDVILELISRFDAERRGESDQVADPAAYAAVTAHHGCDAYFRRRYPQRHRLGTRIRYLLEHASEYAIWKEGEGFICGLASQRGKAALTNLPTNWISQVSLPANLNEQKTVAALLVHAGGPLRLSDLIHAAAALLNVHDKVESTSEIDVADRSWRGDPQIDQRQTLARLWEEVTQLPVPQRTALLLNLRDDEGQCALSSLPATGVASMRAIAEAIEIPAARLAEMWRDLPLSDLRIGEMLGITRQQVINLRKSARQRLSRRMAGNMGAKSDSKRERDEIV